MYRRGWVQSQIMDSAYKYQREIEENERIIVGVNKYKDDEEGKSEVTKINEELIKEKIGKLLILKEKRGNVEEYIDKIAQYATTDENLLPHIIEAVNAKVSLVRFVIHFARSGANIGLRILSNSQVILCNALPVMNSGEARLVWLNWGLWFSRPGFDSRASPHFL